MLSAARPLAHVLWARESEAGAFDTPERRAAFEGRIAEVTAAIARRGGAPLLPAGFFRKASPHLCAGGSFDAPQELYSRASSTRASAKNATIGKVTGGPLRVPRPSTFGDDETYVAASPQLAAGPLHRGHRAAIPRREALILQAVLNHPWLLHDHLEELADAEFRHADTQKLKGALIDVFAHRFRRGYRTRTARPQDLTRLRRSRPSLPGVGFAELSSGSSAPSPRLRCGARGRKPDRPTFWRPGSSLSPCIGNGIP